MASDGKTPRGDYGEMRSTTPWDSKAPPPSDGDKYPDPYGGSSLADNYPEEPGVNLVGPRGGAGGGSMTSDGGAFRSKESETPTPERT